MKIRTIAMKLDPLTDDTPAIVTFRNGEQVEQVNVFFDKVINHHGLTYYFKQGGVVTPMIDLCCETLGRSPDSPKWSIRRRRESEGRWQIVPGATITFPCGEVWDIDAKTLGVPCGTNGVM